MASVCLTQNNFQQHHFEIVNGNMMLQQQQMPLQQNQYAATKLQQIAPAQLKVLGNSNLQNIQVQSAPAPMMAKKKYTYANMPYGEQLPSVARRNARERNRVKQVNNGFANLRQHIPQTVINTLSSGGRGASKKLSKVDTLRIALEYIRGLQDLLDASTPSATKSNSSQQQHSYDESSNDGSNYCYSSYGGSPVPVDQHTSYQMTHSPTSSYSDSDISINGANSFVQPLKLEEPEAQEFKFDFSSDQHDDEELLDYISSWQDQ